MTVAVVTDSTADLSQALLSEWHIRVVPLTITWQGRSYRDRIDLDPVDFLDLLTQSPELPKTAAPAPGAFQAVYQECLLNGAEAILSIHLAGGLSATVRAAEAGARMTAGEVVVVDGESASLGTGLLVLWAAKRARDGVDVHTIVAEVAQLKADLFALTVPITLDYLARGGRIGQAARLLGGMLDLKPILLLKGGSFRPERRVRGERQIVAGLIASAAAQIPPGSAVLAAMGHSGRLDERHQALMDEVQKRWRVAGWLDGVIGPVISAHVGPGAYGLIMVPLSPRLEKIWRGED